MPAPFSAVAGRARTGMSWLHACVALLLLNLCLAPAAMAATKILYAYDNGQLTRTPQPATNTTGSIIVSKGGTKDYVLTPAIPTGKSLVLSAGTINVGLVSFSADSSTLTASLWDGTTQVGTTSPAQVSTTTPTLRTYPVTLASARAPGRARSSRRAVR